MLPVQKTGWKAISVSAECLVGVNTRTYGSSGASDYDRIEDSKFERR